MAGILCAYMLEHSGIPYVLVEEMCIRDSCLSAELAGLQAECKSAEENYRKISDALNSVPAENSIRLSELEKLIEESDSLSLIHI